MWAVDQTAELVRDARQINEQLRALVVLNNADSQGKDNEAAAEALGGIEGIELAPFKIVCRKAFPNATASGLSVVEYDDPKASSELTSLLDSLAVLV